jgi:hypothetical protein
MSMEQGEEADLLNEVAEKKPGGFVLSASQFFFTSHAVMAIY